jgi:hypothetical protein
MLTVVKTTRQSHPKKAASAVSTTTRTTVKPSKGKKKGKGGKASSHLSMGHSSSQCYTHCLFDPFNSCPIKLGVNSLQPTNLSSAKGSGTFTLNSSDGSGSMALIIAQNVLSGSSSPVVYNNLTAGTAGTYNTGAVNPAATALANSAKTFRVISAGLRGFIRVPLTSDPGACSTVDLPWDSTAWTAGSYSTNQIYAHPYARKRVGTRTFNLVWYPHDMTCYEFTQFINSSSFTLPKGTVPAVAFTGYPVSTVVEYEWIVHFEYTVGTTTIGIDSGQNLPGGRTGEPHLDDDAGWFPKIRRAIQYVTETPGLIDNLADGVSAGMSLWNSANRYMRSSAESTSQFLLH